MTKSGYIVDILGCTLGLVRLLVVCYCSWSMLESCKQIHTPDYTQGHALICHCNEQLSLSAVFSHDVPDFSLIQMTLAQDKSKKSGWFLCGIEWAGRTSLILTREILILAGRVGIQRVIPMSCWLCQCVCWSAHVYGNYWSRTNQHHLFWDKSDMFTNHP